jgi:hypothetical protein
LQSLEGGRESESGSSITNLPFTIFNLQFPGVHKACRTPPKPGKIAPYRGLSSLIKASKAFPQFSPASSLHTAFGLQSSFFGADPHGMTGSFTHLQELTSLFPSGNSFHKLPRNVMKSNAVQSAKWFLFYI